MQVILVDFTHLLLTVLLDLNDYELFLIENICLKLTLDIISHYLNVFLN